MKILDVRQKADAPTQKRERSRVLLEPRLADLFRRVCNHLEVEADELFEAMMVLYIQQKTALEMVFEPEDNEAWRDDLQGAVLKEGSSLKVPKATPERREEERRKKERALPTTAERRAKSNRRKG